MQRMKKSYDNDQFLSAKKRLEERGSLIPTPTIIRAKYGEREVTCGVQVVTSLDNTVTSRLYSEALANAHRVRVAFWPVPDYYADNPNLFQEFAAKFGKVIIIKADTTKIFDGVPSNKLIVHFANAPKLICMKEALLQEWEHRKIEFGTFSIEA